MFSSKEGLVGKFLSTTKDIGLLYQLHNEEQLTLKPEFQRNSIWPRSARSYLIDTILEGYPIPMLYLQKGRSAQTQRLEYSVIDGQQRLSTVFNFIENRFMLTESLPDRPWYRKKWKQLDKEHQEAILNYDFTVLEFSGYSEADIREMFQRINKYVVSLNPQELRHSSGPGAFRSLVEEVGNNTFWTDFRIVTAGAQKRMKPHELAAELLILLREGPQDKKSSVDLYYDTYAETFDEGSALRGRLEAIVDYLRDAVPDIANSNQLRKPATFYSLVGVIDQLMEESALPEAETAGKRLRQFDEELGKMDDEASKRIGAYRVAASRQTDNLRPRERRAELLMSVIVGD